MQIFVSTDGNDRYTGSAQNPLRTINRATALSVSGDQILVRPGVYKERVILSKERTSLTALSINNEKVVIDGDNYRLPEMPDAATVFGGTCQYGTWNAFNYAGLVELNANKTSVTGITIRNSRGRGLEVNGQSDDLRTSQNAVIDCHVVESRHAGISAKYFDRLFIQNCTNQAAGNFADFRRPTAKGVPYNHPAACSFQVGTNLEIDGLESSLSLGEGVMFNNIIGGKARRIYSNRNMAGGIYFNATCNFVLDGWQSFYSDDPKLNSIAGSQNQAGVFLNREDHKSDWGKVENTCHDLVIRNGLSVNTDRGIAQLGALGLFLFENILFEHNTIVRPSSGVPGNPSEAIFIATQGKYKNICFEDNLIFLSDPKMQRAIYSNSNNLVIPGVSFNHNAYSHLPAKAYSSPSDKLLTSNTLFDPMARITDFLDVENYKAFAINPPRFGCDFRVFQEGQEKQKKEPALRAGLWSGYRSGVE